MKNLVNTWLSAQYLDMESQEYDNVSWAVDQLFDMAHDEPAKLLKIIIEILKIEASQKIQGALGAGVLEDMLVNHGDKFIDEISKLSETTPDFKKCLMFTYVDENDVSVDVYKTIQKIKGAEVAKS